MSDPEALDEDPRKQPGHMIGSRRRWLGLGAGLAVTALVVAGVVMWLRHSDRTFDAGYGIRMDRPVGVRIWTVLEHGSTAPEGVITIDAIEPDISRDEAEVEVEYAICYLDQDALTKDGVGGSGYGLRDSGVERYCSRLVPAEGSTFQLGTTPGQELLVAVRPTRPGRTVIKTHHIQFSEGWQHGSGDIAATVDITAR